MKPCLDCTIKHAAQILVLLQEEGNHDQEQWEIIGHLAELASHSPKHADAARELRHRYLSMLEGTEDDGVLEGLLVFIREVLTDTVASLRLLHGTAGQSLEPGTRTTEPGTMVPVPHPTQEDSHGADQAEG